MYRAASTSNPLSERCRADCEGLNSLSAVEPGIGAMFSGANLGVEIDGGGAGCLFASRGAGSSLLDFPVALRNISFIRLNADILFLLDRLPCLKWIRKVSASALQGERLCCLPATQEQFLIGLKNKGFLMAFSETFRVRLWARFNVPLIHAVHPSVIVVDDHRCEVKIPLRRRTKNHLRSMYFGALCIGADVAGGLIAMRQIEKQGGGVSLIFKGFKAEFLKRPEGDVHFACEQGEAIGELVRKAISSGERENLVVRVTATVPSVSPEAVAEFDLTLSLKRRS